jgi:hypothetical protein
MTSQVSTEIEISVGQLPSEVLTKIALDIGSGADGLDKIKSRLQSRLRHEPENFKVYISIQCSSRHEAKTISRLLKSKYESTLSGDECIFGQYMEYIMPDPSETPNINFKFVHHNHNAVIIVSSSAYEDQARMLHSMGLDKASEILSSNSFAHFELEAGRSIADILKPLATILLLESLLIKLTLTTEPEAISQFKQLANTLGFHGSKAKRFIAFAFLHTGSSLKLNFKTGTQIPKGFKNIVRGFSGMVPPIQLLLPPPAIELVKEVLEHSGHEVYINVLAENVAFELYLSMKGGSKMLDEDYINMDMFMGEGEDQNDDDHDDDYDHDDDE